MEEPVVEGQVEKGGGYRKDLPREKPKMIMEEPEISKPTKKAHSCDEVEKSIEKMNKALGLLEINKIKQIGQNYGSVRNFDGYNVNQKPEKKDTTDTTNTKYVSAHNPRKQFNTKDERDKFDSRFKGLEKSGVEQGAYGNAGGRPFAGVSTQMDIDASEDYEGATHNDFKEQFKHEKQKPETTMEGHNKKKDSSVSTGTTGVYNATNSSGEKKEEEE